MESVGGCRVVLIGMMGSGKSTVGRLLSKSTGWPYLDNDQLLVSAEGRTARELLADRGTTELRDAEEAALNLGLASDPPCIVGVAGGTILSEASREALAEQVVVYLRTGPQTLFERAKGAAHRPWLDRGQEWFDAAYAERDPLYESVADLTVETDDRPPALIVDEIVAWLRPICSDGQRSNSGR